VFTAAPESGRQWTLEAIKKDQKVLRQPPYSFYVGEDALSVISSMLHSPTIMRADNDLFSTLQLLARHEIWQA
jgi:hypothetical protein